MRRLMPIIATSALIAAGLTPHAHAMGDNLDTMVPGSGAVNCRGGDTCVEKIGDTATVSWLIQSSPIVTSADDSQESGGTWIAIPKEITDIAIDTVALPTTSDDGSPTVQEISHPIHITQGTAATVDDNAWASLDRDPDTWHAVLTDNPGDIGLSPREAEGIDNFQFLYLGKLDPGITTVELTGNVIVESADTYLPIRVSNYGWHCLEGVCDALTVTPEARTGAFPTYSLTDEQINAEIAELQHPAGRLGSPRCAVTSETGRYDLIGRDVTPSAVNRPDYYARNFSLALNPVVGYRISGWMENEDGCDQADMHITLCTDTISEDTPTTTDTETVTQPDEDTDTDTPAAAATTQAPSAPEDGDTTPTSTSDTTGEATHVVKARPRPVGPKVLTGGTPTWIPTR